MKTKTPQQPPHSPFGPSKAHRWLRCHASIIEEARYPSTTSPYAEEGSAAHRLAELCLLDAVEKKRKKPQWYLGKTCDETGLEYTQEMIDNVKVYLKIIFSVYDPHHDEIHVESKLTAPSIGSDFYGTVDCLILQPTLKNIVVVDFKYGRGIAVDATENEQMLCYALMASETFTDTKWKTFSQHIVQPRLDDPAARHTMWEYKKTKLKDLQKRVVEAMRGAKSKNPQYFPSETGCHFCKAQVSCKALQEYNLKILSQDFDFIDDDTEFEFKDPETLTTEQVELVLKNKKLIEMWLSSVQAYAIDLAEKKPGVLPHFKVVHGRSIRQWKFDEKTTVKKLLKVFPSLDKDDLYKSSLFTVAQIEKVIGKDNSDKLESLWSKPQGKLTLVDVNDSRKGISSIDDYE